MNFKPFNLEAAKAGAPIVTRDGTEAKFVTHIPEASEGFRVVWMQRGIVGCSYENGKLGENIDSRHDLFMKPQKRTVWVNIINPVLNPSIIGPQLHARVYLEEKNAINDSWLMEKVLARAIPIEIEEKLEYGKASS